MASFLTSPTVEKRLTGRAKYRQLCVEMLELSAKMMAAYDQDDDDLFDACDKELRDFMEAQEKMLMEDAALQNRMMNAKEANTNKEVLGKKEKKMLVKRANKRAKTEGLECVEGGVVA